ncbi:MAG TPA: aminotransferase class V-fold PLP-dependent enzyme [Candidatus Binatia bacterium]|jgi:dTDP-4-amino-4,6-dideoxygalactose transaminase
MYVPAWPLLNPFYFLRSEASGAPPFPLNAPNRQAFYVARSGIYHLIRALRLKKNEAVLMPDYHSGVEVWAVRAAGARVRYYHINRKMELDLSELSDLCRPNVRAVYLIHYLGWAQPVEAVRDLCRERGIVLIEDCALSLLSEVAGRPLGAFGDYAIFCLYKTLPIPNGGLLVQNGQPLDALTALKTEAGDALSLAARSAELMLEWIHSRSDLVGGALSLAKRAAGKTLSALGVERLPVADITPAFDSSGYQVKRLATGMSPLCAALLKRFDFESIRRKRRENYLFLHELLAGKVPSLVRELEEGMCPLFFPLLVADKHAAAQALRSRGISAVEFWNYGYPEASAHTSADAQFLRDHALELPIHQDVTEAQIEYMAEQVLRLLFPRLAHKELNPQRSRPRGRRLFVRSLHGN